MKAIECANCRVIAAEPGVASLYGWTNLALCCWQGGEWERGKRSGGKVLQKPVVASLYGWTRLVLEGALKG